MITMIFIIKLFIASFAIHQYINAENIKLRVGLYNYLPDLACDDLKSYKDFVEKRFNEYVNGSIELEAVVDKRVYYPYSSLDEFGKYLSDDDDGFDLIEIDTISLGDLADREWLLPLDTQLSTDYFPASLKAVRYNGQYYAYPTLVCGNFLLSPGPVSSKDTCDLRKGKNNFNDLLAELDKCNEEYIRNGTFSRLLAGVMNDEYGWYLPGIYLDGYIDIYGTDSLNNALDKLLSPNGYADYTTCKNINAFINFCGTQRPSYFSQENKCFDQGTCRSSTYTKDTHLVYEDIANQHSRFMFGFSETVSNVYLKTGQADGQGTLIAPAMGDQNHILMFTDAIAINQAKYENASTEKKNAMKTFISFFTDEEFRTDFLLGKDLPNEQIKYLLAPTSSFYNKPVIKDNQLFQDVLGYLENAVPMPILTDVQRQALQDTLIRDKCINISDTVFEQLETFNNGMKLISFPGVLIGISFFWIFNLF